MTIATFLDSSQLPNQSQDQQTFDNAMAYVMQNFPKWGSEVNATLGQFNAGLAGGAYAMAYVVDLTSTADADPGAGRLRFNAATQSSATSLFVDLLAGGLDVTGLLDSLVSSTSAIKGKIRLVKMGDQSKWLTFDVAGITASTGYRGLSISGAVGSSPSPFANTDSVLLFFQRTGDKGDAGYTSYMKVSERYASSAAQPSAVVASTQTRNLNTVDWNDLAGASLASGIVTLAAGTYEVFGRAPGYSVSGHQAWLRNITDSTTTLLGASAYAISGSGSFSDSTITGRFTISATKQFQIVHYTNVGGKLGYSAGSSGSNNEIYAELTFKKVG